LTLTSSLEESKDKWKIFPFKIKKIHVQGEMNIIKHVILKIKELEEVFFKGAIPNINNDPTVAKETRQRMEIAQMNWTI